MGVSVGDLWPPGFLNATNSVINASTNCSDQEKYTDKAISPFTILGLVAAFNDTQRLVQCTRTLSPAHRYALTEESPAHSPLRVYKLPSTIGTSNPLLTDTSPPRHAGSCAIRVHARPTALPTSSWRDLSSPRTRTRRGRHTDPK